MRGFYAVLGMLVLLPIIIFFSIGKDLFAIIYEVFTSLYGKDLALHLYGWNGINFDDISNYVPNGFLLYFFTLFSVVLFYYIIDHVKFSTMKNWGVVLLINALIVYFISFYFFVYLDYSSDEIAPDIASLIHLSHLHYWGLTNAIYSLVLFFIFSFSIRWWSTNCANTPLPR